MHIKLFELHISKLHNYFVQRPSPSPIASHKGGQGFHRNWCRSARVSGGGSGTLHVSLLAGRASGTAEEM